MCIRDRYNSIILGGNFMSKKVLIMSASTGGGHNRAARAIKEELESRTIDNMSIECEIVDSLKLVNNTMDKVISRGYEKSALYTPKAYGSVYRFSETTIASKNEFKTNPLTSLMARKFKHLLNESTPDLIIGTHPFPMIALSTLKKNNNLHSLSRSESFYKSTKVDIPPMISVLTDYTTHSTWIQNEIDYYIAVSYTHLSCASASSATSAFNFFGGDTQIRTGDQGVAVHCLTTWLCRRTGDPSACLLYTSRCV